jgi:hypothetical protein
MALNVAVWEKANTHPVINWAGRPNLNAIKRWRRIGGLPQGCCQRKKYDGECSKHGEPPLAILEHETLRLGEVHNGDFMSKGR